MIKSAIVVWDEAPHFLDHLAPLAAWLGFPLLLPNHKDYDLVRRYYPDAPVHFALGHELVVEELYKQYDLLLYSTFNRKALGTNRPSVFVPHGNSDKAGHLPYFLEEEAVFVYGQRMLDFIGAPLKNPIIVGNWRKAYYEERQLTFLSPFTKPVILYAPSLGAFHEEILDVPDGYNLLIKLHPQHERNHPGLVAKIREKANLRLLNDYPLIYPVLAKVDLYVGDISSVGYDFLAFDKPLVFLEGESLYSHRFGRVAPARRVWQEIERALEDDHHYSQARQEGYRYTFAPRPPKEEVYKTLEALL